MASHCLQNSDSLERLLRSCISPSSPILFIHIPHPILQYIWYFYPLIICNCGFRKHWSLYRCSCFPLLTTIPTLGYLTGTCDLSRLKSNRNYSTKPFTVPPLHTLTSIIYGTHYNQFHFLHDFLILLNCRLLKGRASDLPPHHLAQCFVHIGTH